MRTRLLAATTSGVCAGGLCAWVAGCGTAISFWLFWTMFIPNEISRFPLTLKFPRKFQGPGSGWRGGSDSGRELVERRADGGAGRALAATDTSMTCAEVSLESLLASRRSVGNLQVDFAARLPAEAWGRRLEPVVCTVELLAKDGTVVASASQPLWLPEPHWIIEAWSAVIWGPLIALGLCRTSPYDFEAPVLENVRLEATQLPAVTLAHVCLKPPVPAQEATLVFRMRLGYPLRIVQLYPVLSGLLLVVLASAAAAASAACGTFLLVWLPGGGGASANASVGASAGASDAQHDNNAVVPTAAKDVALRRRK